MSFAQLRCAPVYAVCVECRPRRDVICRARYNLKTWTRCSKSISAFMGATKAGETEHSSCLSLGPVWMHMLSAVEVASPAHVGGLTVRAAEIFLIGSLRAFVGISKGPSTL